MKRYKLEGTTPVLEKSDWAWEEWYKKANRRVARDTIGTALISTVFLGVNRKPGTGLWLFETRIFGGGHGGFREQYRTWKEAKEGHAQAVKKVNRSQQ